MYEFILFDFDGTVFDTLEGITKSVRYAINKHGMDAELDALRCFAGPPLVDMFIERFSVDRDMGVQLTEDFRERYNPIGLYECRVFPGVKELLESLHGAGKKLAIATSKPQNLAEELLARENMTDYFDAICGSLPTGNNSAKWQVVERAMREIGADRKRAVLIGDTKYDVEGAIQCGIDCIGVKYGYAAPGEMEAAGAKCVVEDASALKQLLLNE